MRYLQNLGCVCALHTAVRYEVALGRILVQPTSSVLAKLKFCKRLK